MLDNGSNNGSLFMGVRDAAARMGASDVNVARKAFDELIETGFIKVQKEAHFHVKAAENSRARCWQLTWLPCNNRAPTREFTRFNPTKGTKAWKRMTAGLEVIARYKKRLNLGHFPVLESNTTD